MLERYGYKIIPVGSEKVERDTLIHAVHIISGEYVKGNGKGGLSEK